MNRIPLLALSAVFLTTGFTFRDPVTIKRTPKVGDTATYNTDATMTVNGQEGHFAAKASDKVTAVDNAAGTYTVTESESDLTYNDAPVGSDNTATHVQKLSGELISVTSDQDMGGSLFRTSTLLEPYYPAAPLNVGDTFTMDIKSTVAGAVPVHVDGKLVSLEKVGSFDTAKLEETVKETEGADAAASIHSFLWINTADGSVVKQMADLTNVPFGPIVVSTGKMSLTRIQS